MFILFIYLKIYQNGSEGIRKETNYAHSASQFAFFFFVHFLCRYLFFFCWFIFRFGSTRTTTSNEKAMSITTQSKPKKINFKVNESVKSSVFWAFKHLNVYTFSNIVSTFCLSTSFQSASIEINPSENHRYHFFCLVHFFHSEPKKKKKKSKKITKIGQFSISFDWSDHFVYLFYHWKQSE